MDKKIFRTISCGVCYMYNQEMQSLVEVRPLREVFNLNNGKATQEWRVADTDHGDCLTLNLVDLHYILQAINVNF